MFSAEEYLLSWSIYLSAAIGLIMVFWRLTRDMVSWLYVRQLLRLSIAILLLTPYFVDESGDYLAPAWAMAGLDMLFSGVTAFWRAGGPLLIIWCTTVLLYYLLVVMYKVLVLTIPVNSGSVPKHPSGKI